MEHNKLTYASSQLKTLPTFKFHKAALLGFCKNMLSIITKPNSAKIHIFMKKKIYCCKTKDL